MYRVLVLLFFTLTNAEYYCDTNLDGVFTVSSDKCSTAKCTQLITSIMIFNYSSVTFDNVEEGIEIGNILEVTKLNETTIKKDQVKDNV